ncbi:cupin [candidate division WWE3 bacterium RIFOXYC1_FULL_39_7]|uniref:Cupin n=2 Tax=Katanobacteria TaxID=422282 RepID=A0A1F4X3I4_UNCKA|nr:MAG: cupin [candidate division WWE3 bacterium RIFOXYC1_FULL_39_7]OGC76166.1 MAG: cupin [candidate division WWE3 bacterium RIFOXYD1_FULL_39_9]
MKGFVTDIGKATVENNNFRKVLYTAKNCQLVLMSIKPGEEIGNEKHTLDQFLRIEQGKAHAILNNGETEYDLETEFAIIVPAGTWHNLINTGDTDLKLYSIYSPPEHKDKTVHATKEEAVEEHYDGLTTEV